MKLEIGHNHPFEVRTERLDTSVGVNMRILFLSDLHLNKRSKYYVEAMINAIKKCAPDVLLFGGDYADSQKGMTYFDLLLNSTLSIPEVLVIPGNHDRLLGLSQLKNIASKNAAKWIEGQSHSFRFNNLAIIVSNAYSSSVKIEADLSISLIHKPKKINSLGKNFDLIFAGHLHGSQIVLWKKKERLYPGRFIYKWNVLKEKVGKSTLIVSKGLGDTLPIRLNCKKEMILVEVN